MQVNSVSNFNYGSRFMLHNEVEQPQPDSKQPEEGKEKPVDNGGVTASLYFTGREDKSGKGMRKAALAGMGSLIILGAMPSCEESEVFTDASTKTYAKANTYVSTHPKGCTCPECSKNRDTLYIYEPGKTDTVYVDRPGENDTDTVYITLPNETIYVDTGSYHVTHDTITKWKYDFQKPIPLDTLSKITGGFDIPTQDPSRKNIVNYQGVREWEYGNKFVANINLLESSRNILVYDREDKDWEDKHTGWGKDVFRIPTSSFTIETYDGRTINSPKGFFFETYTNNFNQKSSIYDNTLTQRYFCQTQGNKIVKVFSYDPSTNLYREDGSVGKGYLDKNTKGNNILLKDLISSDHRWSDDPEYETDDHIIGIKLTALNDEELQLLYLRQRDDEFAEQHYGVAH